MTRPRRSLLRRLLGPADRAFGMSALLLDQLAYPDSGSPDGAEAELSIAVTLLAGELSGPCPAMERG